MMIQGAQVMAAVLIATYLAAAVTAAFVISGAVMASLAKRRAALLVSRARHLITAGIYDDADGRPGPAKLLREAYGLQCTLNIGSRAIGLRDEAELDELINRAIRGDWPCGPLAAPKYFLEEEELTRQDFTVGDRIAAEDDRSLDDGDEYLRYCADFAAGLPRFTREDLN